jgi:hypothetical protein
MTVVALAVIVIPVALAVQVEAVPLLVAPCAQVVKRLELVGKIAPLAYEPDLTARHTHVDG